jgi:hypothetical protein
MKPISQGSDRVDPDSGSLDEDAKAALMSVPQTGTGAALVADIRALVEPFGGVELELPIREPMRDRGMGPLKPSD